VAEKPKDIASLSFEDALAELESIVNKLESGEVGLEASIDLYTRGTALKSHCDAKLKDAEARIQKLTLDAAGEPQGTEPFAEE